MKFKFFKNILSLLAGISLATAVCAQSHEQAPSTISLVDSNALTLTNGIYGNIINGQNFQQDALRNYKGLYLIYVRKDHFDSKTETAPLVVVKAIAKKHWLDWHEIYVSPENYFNEPQINLDESRHELAMLAQDGPPAMGASSAFKVVTIKLN